MKRVIAGLRKKYRPKPVRWSFATHAQESYERLVRIRLAEYPDDRSLALARCIGADDMALFHAIGDVHVAVLRHHGLQDGMAIYDLGCGCGRTAQALQRTGWQGDYIGADIVPELVDELIARCPGYTAHTHRQLSLVAPDASQDMVFHWSVFTHLLPEECLLYMHDCYRALKPGGRMVFSFLEFEALQQRHVFDDRLPFFRNGKSPDHLDTFLHRDWIRLFARQTGFGEPRFTDGTDDTHHPQFWQSLAAMDKPLA